MSASSSSFSSANLTWSRGSSIARTSSSDRPAGDAIPLLPTARWRLRTSFSICSLSAFSLCSKNTISSFLFCKSCVA
eukprot:759328-Hanusia_phi.AAC.1